MGRPRVINEERLLREQLNLPKGVWRKSRENGNAYMATFKNKSRTTAARYRPRLTFKIGEKTEEPCVLNIWYPSTGSGEIDFKLTRRKFEKEFKSLLQPKKSLTIVERDNSTDNKKYSVDYYCTLHRAPNVETFDKIFSICQNPVIAD